MTTVYGGDAVVNPQPGHLGAGVPALYDWLRSKRRTGRMRRVEVTPPVSAYEQVARQLRERIFSGDYPPGAKIPSGWTKGRYPVSQPVVQRACALLESEGLVRMESGHGTTVLDRSRWLVTFEARLPLDDAARAAALSRVRVALRAVVREQPAVGGEDVQRSAIGLALAMTVESASPRGAVTAAFAVAERALGSLPIVAQSVREAQ